MIFCTQERERMEGSLNMIMSRARQLQCESHHNTYSLSCPTPCEYLHDHCSCQLTLSNFKFLFSGKIAFLWKSWSVQLKSVTLSRSEVMFTLAPPPARGDAHNKTDLMLIQPDVSGNIQTTCHNVSFAGMMASRLTGRTQFRHVQLAPAHNSGEESDFSAHQRNLFNSSYSVRQGCSPHYQSWASS